jgi:hypothetical protein
LYSITLIDHAGRAVESRNIEAINVLAALTQANRRICRIFNSAGRTALDPKGRVDVLDDRGSPVARIYCAEALHALS